MNNVVREKLAFLLANEREDLITNPRKLSGLLFDYCPNDRKEIRTILTAMEEHIPQELLRIRNSSSKRIEISRLFHKLLDATPLSDEAALWAVETWAIGLKILNVSDLSKDADKHVNKRKEPENNPDPLNLFPNNPPTKTPTTHQTSRKMWPKPPDLEIETNRTYIVDIQTNKGDITIELYPQYAPRTANNFVFLARQQYYDGVSFHRVIANFMIQGGDPTGTGMGGPGYKFGDEFVNNPLKHARGVLSMANAGPGTNGSQFFITHSSQPHLNGKHTVFGNVVSGMEVVDSIRQGDKMITVRIRE